MLHTLSASTQGPDEGFASSYGSDALGSVTLAHATNVYSLRRIQLLTRSFKGPFAPRGLPSLLSPLLKAPHLLLLREVPAPPAEHQSLYHKQGLGLCEKRPQTRFTLQLQWSTRTCHCGAPCPSLTAVSCKLAMEER